MLSCSEDPVGVSSQTSSVREDTQTTPVKETPQETKDRTSLGITKESFHTVTGKIKKSQKEQTSEAEKTFINTFVNLKLATKKEANILMSGSNPLLIASQGITKDVLEQTMAKIAQKISALLGDIQPEEVTIIFDPEGTTDKKCRNIKDRIKNIPDSMQKDKAWAFIRFIPSLRNAMGQSPQTCD